MWTILGALLVQEKVNYTGISGHQELELALMRLYKVLLKQEYLELAEFFVEERGKYHGAFFDEQAIARGEDPKITNQEPQVLAIIQKSTGTWKHTSPSARRKSSVVTAFVRTTSLESIV